MKTANIKNAFLIKRLVFAACIILALFCILIVVTYARAALTKPIVLTYHSIMDEPATEYANFFVRQSDFEEQIAFLKSEGFEFLFAHEYDKPCKKGVIITFDDGYKDNLTTALPVLQKYNAKATIFVTTGLLGRQLYLTEEDVKLMAANPLISFGSHTVSHPDLTSASDAADIAEEFSESKDVLENLTGQDVETVAYPFGAINTMVTKIASEYFGFGYATTWGYSGDLFSIKRITISRDTKISDFRQYFSQGSRLKNELKERLKGLSIVSLR